MRRSESGIIAVILGLLTVAPSVCAQQSSLKAPNSSAAKPQTGPTSIRIGGVTLSGSVRARVESWNWFETDRADSDDTFGAVTLRFALSQEKDGFDWLVEGQVPILAGLPSNSIAPPPQGQLGLGASYFAANGHQDASINLRQAFVRFKGLPGDKPSNLRIGRFEFNEGAELTPSEATLATVKRDHISQRLIGTFAFSHVGRSFDGVHYARNFKSGNLTVVGARPTEGVFQLSSNRELDVDFYYGAFTRPLQHEIGASEFRAFAVHYHDGRPVLKTDNRSAFARAADTEKIRLTTVGGHYIGAYKAGAGKVDVLLWGAGQFGDWGNLDHGAGAIAAEAGYSLGGSSTFANKLKPWVRAGYYRSTGDNDPLDADHGTFFSMLPTPRIYARTPAYNAMNNQDVFVQLRMRPHARLGLRFDVHHLQLSSSQDLWYTGGGAFQKRTFGYVGRPSSGNRSLGVLSEISADVTIANRTAMTFYVGGIRGGKVQSAIYPPRGSKPVARFVYLEFVQRF